jgi:hypothetical protein
MAKQTFTTGQVLTAAQMTSLQQTAMGGGSTTAKTTSYTLVTADAGTVVQMNSASATTITVNTALFAAGDTVQIQNVGAGVCTVTAGTATVSTSATLALKQYDAGTLYFNTTSAAIFFAVDAADGMTNPFTTTGDTVYASGGTTPTRLGIGSTGQVLTVASGIPSWATAGFTQIAQTIVTGSSAASVSFSSLGSYTNLKVVMTARGVAAAAQDDIILRFNGDSGSNYDFQRLNNNGVTVSANENFAVSFLFPGTIAANTAASGLAGTAIVEIPDYRNTTYEKNTLSRNGVKIGTSSTNQLTKYNYGAWRNTAAITSLTFSCLGGNIGIGSIFTLYGEL